MAPGPHCVVEKEKPLSFNATTAYNGHREYDDEEDLSTYKYYESGKVLGKLYRAIDEQEIFGVIQRRKRSGAKRSESNKRLSGSVLESVWAYVYHRCKLFVWDNYLNEARDIREAYVQSS